MGRTLYVTKKCDFTKMKYDAPEPGSQNKRNQIQNRNRELILSPVSRPVSLRKIVPEPGYVLIYLSVSGTVRTVATIFATRSATISGVTAFRQR